MENSSKATEAIKALAKTTSSMSEASHFLSLAIDWLAHDENLVENIKPNLDYLYTVSRAVRNRAEGVFENVRGKVAIEQMNNKTEDEFSESISYDVYSKAHSVTEHLHKMKDAIDKAKADGEDMTEWMLKNTNIEDVITGKVKKPWTPQPAGIGKILREWRGDRYSLYAIAKECGCRAEGLQRIEDGKDVTTTNLMHYLHFVKNHDPQSDVIAAIWQAL